MIDSLEFRNFKVLKGTKLPLGRFTLLVGPNGSGKSTALQAFEPLRNPGAYTFGAVASASVRSSEDASVEILLAWASPPRVFTRSVWRPSGLYAAAQFVDPQGNQIHGPGVVEGLRTKLNGIRVYSLDPGRLATPISLQPRMELAPDGSHLAGVLDRLRDEAPERFEALNQEVGRLLPEYDRILFDTPAPGVRGFELRSRQGRHRIPASHVSHGTLLALALLTLAHLPEPPPLIGLEDPDRGIHPRLLRDVRDALYRLSYPDSYKEDRPPVQVVATTQSPYFLDLFKDQPEEIVIAQKDGLEARFERLVDRTDVREILADAPLGDVWYSGVLGGVPSNR